MFSCQGELYTNGTLTFVRDAAAYECQLGKKKMGITIYGLACCQLR